MDEWVAVVLGEEAGDQGLHLLQTPGAVEELAEGLLFEVGAGAYLFAELGGEDGVGLLFVVLNDKDT